MSPIELHLDKSSGHNIRLERDGKPVGLEAAFSEGFSVGREDSNAVLQLIATFLVNRDQFQK